MSYRRNRRKPKPVRKIIYLHNEIMEHALGRPLRSDERVEFVNGDSLDCRRSNLRVVTVPVQ